MNKSVENSRKQKTISSALWAAYGDALGFPTELANANFVIQRIGAPLSTRSVKWRRLVGGRFGAQVDLCKGAYSDDTQLRLATSRAISDDGYFDVEAFAKIELPVWLSYCLGAGRGSKAAASSLGERSANWFSNFYSSDNADYIKGGGNGAAMRVQPHVWSAADLSDERAILSSVIRNAVCTHGHVRGIAGAMIHAVALARTIRTGKIPEVADWVGFSEVINALPTLVKADSDLNTFWLSSWEKANQITLENASDIVSLEWESSVEKALRLLNGSPSSAYFDVVSALGGLTEIERGSGLKCALFSLAGAWLFRESGPRACIETIANLLSSDTDTIASMAGALIGALPNQDTPDDEIQDKKYLEADATRLFHISQKQRPSRSFTYPDLLYWQPPKSPLDAVGTLDDDGLAMFGLGRIVPIGDEFKSTQKGTVWQWFHLEFGQTVLCKRRVAPKKLPPEALHRIQYQPKEQSKIVKSSLDHDLHGPSVLPRDLFSLGTVEKHTQEKANVKTEISIDSLTDVAIRSNFDPKTIGDALLRICNEENAIELALGYVAIVVKARKARLKRGF